jgi:hypothetical protein
MPANEITQKRRAAGVVAREDDAQTRSPRPFDLIELTTAIAGYPVGSRGTVVVQGVGQVMVDFARNDGGARPAGPDRLQVVPNASMRVIADRSFNDALGAQSATRPSAESARTRR